MLHEEYLVLPFDKYGLRPSCNKWHCPSPHDISVYCERAVIWSSDCCLTYVRALLVTFLLLLSSFNVL